MGNVLLAIGISRYMDGSGLESIPCAVSDAVSAYDTLKEVLGADFDGARSVVASDLSSSEARALIESRARTLGSEDRLILYFSGHAQISSKPLALVFSDADESRRGRVLVSELAALTRHCECIYILDCCYSGGATSLANSASAFDPSKVSVLAATSPWVAAKHTVDGSPFTNAICKHARSASLAGSALGLNELARLINTDRDYQGDCQVNVREGLPDVLLFGSVGVEDAYSDIGSRFIRRLDESHPAERETLWYMANALPLPAQGEVARAWARQALPAEGGWLVRRAMGTFLSELPFDSSERADLTAMLLESNNWMERVVGLLGAKRLVAMDEYRTLTRELLISHRVPMDVSWLASLYLADAGIWDLDGLRGSGLLESTWGQIEAFDQLGRIICDSDTKSSRMRDLADSCVASGISCEGLATHLRLRDKSVHVGVEPDMRVVGDELAHYLYRRAERGRLTSGTGKWLFSALYGNWRGEARSDLGKYAGSVSIDSLVDSVALMGSLPSVPLRMALLVDPYMADNERCCDAALGWGLLDCHPWVRRVAVELAGRRGQQVHTLEMIDRQVFPGVLDLLIAIGRSGAPWSESDVVPFLTHDEVAAVRRDVEGSAK